MTHEFVTSFKAVAKLLRCNFTLRDQPITIDQALDDAGLLPSIMRRADQLSSFCMGFGLGVSFDEVSGTMLGVKVKFDSETPNSLRLLCATDVLIEIIQSAPSREVTPLDDLMYD